MCSLVIRLRLVGPGVQAKQATEATEGDPTPCMDTNLTALREPPIDIVYSLKEVVGKIRGMAYAADAVVDVAKARDTLICGVLGLCTFEQLRPYANVALRVMSLAYTVRYCQFLAKCLC